MTMDYWKKQMSFVSRVPAVALANLGLLVDFPAPANASEVASSVASGMNSTSMTLALGSGNGTIDAVGLTIITSSILFAYAQIYNVEL